LSGAAFAVAILTPNPANRWSILFDAGQAAALMQLAAWALGVGSCPATIYEPEQARQILGFPDEYYLNVILSFGYPADSAALSEPLKTGGRRAFDETVHMERW
jgi:nitroreductase